MQWVALVLAPYSKTSTPFAAPSALVVSSHRGGVSGEMAHSVAIEVSDETLAALRRDPDTYASDLRLAAAAKLYEIGEVSQEIAAEIAGLTRTEFMLGARRFQVSPFQETAASLAEQLTRG